MVTDRKLRWVPRADLRFAASLDLDDVQAVSERFDGHRYRLGLRHAPINRLRHAPAHRFATWQWGNTTEMRESTQTDLAFSRRDTKAASALRHQLTFRGAAWPPPVRIASRRERPSRVLMSQRSSSTARTRARPPRKLPRI